MGRHSLPDDHPDQPPEEIPVQIGNTVVESKVLASSAASLVAGIVVALCNAVLADSSILGGSPPWMQFTILAVAPAVLSFAAGYVQTSNRTG